MPSMRNEPLVLSIGTDSYLVVRPNALETIEANVGGRSDFTEAGGILIGSYRGNHIEIVDCTFPKPQDVRRRTLFDRKDKGHHLAAMAAWRRSGKTETFVGEWHTHPEDHPHYSALDRRTWDNLMRRIPEPLVFCIAGWRSTWWGIGYGRLLVPLRQ
jgi:integrative and conjugative element protein (TIGR02256 family)